jgi:hypothetical protein
MERKARRVQSVKKYRIWLKRPEDVRRLLSSLINELRRGEIDPSTAGKIGYLANILMNTISVIDQQELTDRVKILESRLAEQINAERGW